MINGKWSWLVDNNMQLSIYINRYNPTKTPSSAGQCETWPTGSSLSWLRATPLPIIRSLQFASFLLICPKKVNICQLSIMP